MAWLQGGVYSVAGGVGCLFKNSVESKLEIPDDDGRGAAIVAAHLQITPFPFVRGPDPGVDAEWLRLADAHIHTHVRENVSRGASALHE